MVGRKITIIASPLLKEWNLKKDYFLGDPEKIKKLMEAVADQGKTNPGGRK